MPKSTREILIEARELITPPENWSGPKDHPHASHCYCAATAIWQAADESDSPYGATTSSVASVPAGDALAKAAGIKLPSSECDETGLWHPIYDWNDHTAHDVVLATFDQAIEAQPV
jgi:hypothetical protein